MKIRIFFAALVAVLALSSLGGCAVKKTNNVFGERTEIDLDYAAVFGKEESRFKMADGGEGTLRSLSGVYSLKVHNNSRVLPIENALFAKIVRTENLGDRTVVVIEAAEMNCKSNTRVYSIRGSEVLMWRLQNCNSRPDLSVEGESLHFDFDRGRDVVRLTYRDGSMFEGAGVAKAGLETKPPLSDKTQAGTSPMAPRFGSKSARAASAGNKTTPAPSFTKEQASLPSTNKTMNFPDQKMKPVVINLEK